MNRAAILQVRNLSKSFPGVNALVDVRLDIEPGEVHAVIGENGAGKSTLMKVLIGLHRPDAGAILWKGQAIRIKNPHDALRRGIAMIHQELLPFRELTVAENIAMGREPTRWFPGWVDRAAMNREAARLLDRLGVALSPTRKMKELSVAQMQTIEIAKALAYNAGVIIMDEPTSAISDREVEALFGVIRDLKQRGVGVIYISHKLDEIFRIADTITVLRDGRHVTTQPSRELDEQKLISLMVGRDLIPAKSGRGSVGEPVLAIRNLTSPGKFHHVSFQLHRGEILGLAGLMGAGRTDLANAIYGLSPAASGGIEVNGHTIDVASPADAIAAGIALVSEDRRQYGFVPCMTVKHNITLASIRNWFVNHRAENNLADDQIRAFAIKVSSRNQLLENLSGGNQQKVVIAKVLLSEPDVLILDEPGRGIDIGAKSDVYAIIKELASSGKAILLVSSELPELLSLADRLLVMREGEVTAELDPRHTCQEEIMRYAMPN